MFLRKLTPHFLSSFLYGIILAILFLLPAAELAKRATQHQLSIYRQDGLAFASDFVRFYTAGKIALSDERYRCYDRTVQESEFRRVLGPTNVTPEVMHIQYVPVVFPLMAPFALVPIDTAHAIWCLVSLAVAAAGGCLMLRQVRQLGWNDCGLWLLAVVASYPVFMTLLLGQISLIALGLFLIYFWAWYQKRDVLAGSIFALSIVKPHYAVFWILPALIGRRWKLLIAFVCSELVLLGITAATIGLHNIIDYPKFLLQVETTFRVNAPAMPCLRGVLNLFLPDEIASKVTLVIFALSIVLLSFVWQRILKKDSDGTLWLMLVGTLLALLVSPHTHTYDCTLIAAAGVMLPGMRLWNSVKARPVSYKLWCLILMFYPILSWSIVISSGLSPEFRAVGFVAINAILFLAGSVMMFKKLRVDGQSV
jgi:hypothetical protein